MADTSSLGMAFGPDDSFCFFNCADLGKAASKNPLSTNIYSDNLPDKITSLLDKKVQISSLALGEAGRYAAVYRETETKSWTIDCDELLPESKDWVETHIKNGDGSYVRVVLGPGKSYLAFDVCIEFAARGSIQFLLATSLRAANLIIEEDAAKTKSREYDSQQLPDDLFRWIRDTAREPDKNRTFKEDYLPSSIALGPDGMFCVTHKSGCISSANFKRSFPYVDAFLAKHVGKVTIALGSVSQSTSDGETALPYYSLTTANGLCIGNVPRAAYSPFTCCELEWSLYCTERLKNDETNNHSKPEPPKPAAAIEYLKQQQTILSNETSTLDTQKETISNMIDKLDSQKAALIVEVTKLESRKKQLPILLRRTEIQKTASTDETQDDKQNTMNNETKDGKKGETTNELDDETQDIKKNQIFPKTDEDDVETEETTLIKAVKNLETQSKNLIKLVDRLEAQQEMLAKDIKYLQTRKEELDKDVEDLTRVDNVVQLYIDEKLGLDEKIEDLGRSESSKQTEISRLTGENEALRKTQPSDKDSRIADLEGDKRKLDGMISELTKANNDLTGENRTNQNRITQLERDSQAFRAQPKFFDWPIKQGDTFLSIAKAKNINVGWLFLDNTKLTFDKLQIGGTAQVREPGSWQQCLSLQR